MRLEARSLGVECRDEQHVASASLGLGPARPTITGRCAQRNLDSASLAALATRTSASGLFQPSGHLYGRARTSGAPIVLDRFAHASHNAIVLGQTGTGKTMFTGAEMARCFMRGLRVMGVDPLGDYRRLTETLGGTYVELGAGGGLDPLAIDTAETRVPFAAKLALVRPLAGAMAGGLSRDERPALDGLSGRRTKQPHQTDPASHERRPPTLAALVERLAEMPEAKRWPIGSSAGRPAGWRRSSRPTVRCHAMSGCSSSGSQRSAIRRFRRRPARRAGRPVGCRAVGPQAQVDRRRRGLEGDAPAVGSRLRRGAGPIGPPLPRRAPARDPGHRRVPALGLRRGDRQAVRHPGPARSDARGRRGHRPVLRSDRRRAPLPFFMPDPAKGSSSSGAATSRSRHGSSKREYEWLTTRPADLVGQSQGWIQALRIRS